MLNKLAFLADRIIITRPNTDRAVPPQELLPSAKRYKKNHIEIVEKPSLALQRALLTADGEDLICVTGSLYLVGEIKQAFAGILR